MEYPKRKPARLPCYDYSSHGAYFLTICSYGHKQRFSRIVGAIHESPAVHLTEYGTIIQRWIQDLPERFGVKLPHFVIMPNHVHLLVLIDDETPLRAIRESPLRSRSVISKLVGYLKMNVSRDIHNLHGNSAEKIWQRSFHDHVIRSEKDYLRIWSYIDTNPSRWTEDCFYCASPSIT